MFVMLQQENSQHEEDGDVKHQETSLSATKQGDKKSKKGRQSPDREKEIQQQKEDEHESSDEEQEKMKNGTLSDHSSDEVEAVTEVVMQRSLSQEFTLINGKIAALQKLEKQHQEREKMQAKTAPVNDTPSTNSITTTAAANNSSGVKSQSPNQKTQQQQPTLQKTRPVTTAPTNKPSEGQYTTMTSRRQQQQQQPQQAKDAMENGQKYYSGEHNTRLPPQQRQTMKDKETMAGRDSRDTRYHYAPNPNRIKQLPPRFQRMAQEQMANQQQQQQQYVRNNLYSFHV